MKKLMDKLLLNIKFDKRYVLFSLTLVILGIITGAIFIVILNTTDKNIVIEYIQNYIENIKVGNYNYMEILKNISIINYAIIFILFIIGFTYFLFPINILILFYKSFIIGFSISSFILVYNIKGIILSIIYIFPHLIINILLFSLITSFTLKLSLNMIKYIINKKQVNMRQYFNKYLYIILLSCLLIFFTSLYETFISTFLLNLITKILI